MNKEGYQIGTVDGQVIFVDVTGKRKKRQHNGAVIIGVTDEKGKFPERTRITHPYAYDPVCWFYGDVGATNNSAYHDRMQTWDYDKFERCLKDHIIGGTYGFKNAQQVEKFLRAYWDDPELILTCIVEYCNVSNGFPCYRFDMKMNK